MPIRYIDRYIKAINFTSLADLSISLCEVNEQTKEKEMNKIFGLMAALMISGQAMAYAQDDSPPFQSLICEAGNVSVQVEIQHYRQTYGAGPASIKSGNYSWGGGWNWKAAEQRTRLTGYHFLTIKAGNQNGNGAVYLHTLYSPYGKLSGGWLEAAGYSGPVDCEILD